MAPMMESGSLPETMASGRGVSTVGPWRNPVPAKTGGGGEIRTREGLSTPHALQACALDHSATPPSAESATTFLRRWFRRKPAVGQCLQEPFLFERAEIEPDRGLFDGFKFAHRGMFPTHGVQPIQRFRAFLSVLLTHDSSFSPSLAAGEPEARSNRSRTASPSPRAGGMMARITSACCESASRIWSNSVWA